MKICPKCKLLSHDGAARCDCGWDFESATQHLSSIAHCLRRCLLPAVLLLVALLLGPPLFAIASRDTAALDITGLLWPSQPRLAPFALEDARGGRLDESALRGKWTLLFLGFTHCPDICPTTLNTLRGVHQLLRDYPPFVRDGQVLFVSVDYERDTAAVLRPYVEYFDPSFRAASAPPAELHLLTRQLDMSAVKTSSDDGPDYWFEHSSEIVLIGPALQVVGLFDFPHAADDLATRIRAMIEFMRKAP